ncbi:MAG TPA: HEAT repeat domain-containing protein, partial [Planctomycetaceae bacterium]|nr:HEAT repeat domain-containing protein [Planctomycetaceae bacterium]
NKHALAGLTPSRSPFALKRINPHITCNLTRIDLPLAPLPSREDWEQAAKDAGVTGSRARYFLQMLDEGKEIPTTIPDYPVQTWCFGEDLAMVFLGGEVVVDYSIRMNDMFDSDRLWINAYSNDVPCYIASGRLLREGGYECDSSMLYYRRPTRLAPETEDLICDAVQKLLPHHFYSEKLQQDFPAPKSPAESYKCMTTKPDLRVVLAASEPLIHDPVAFDWDERGRLWVVEMGDYPKGEGRSEDLGSSESHDAQTTKSKILNPKSSSGRVRLLEDTDKDGVYDKATTFLDGLAFPNGIQCWRGGVIVTMAPEIFYAEDTDGDGAADVRQTLYKGFVEGNQQHRVNGLRWGLDGWLYLANGDSGGEIVGTGLYWKSGKWTADSGESQSADNSAFPSPLSALSLRGRDLRIFPDTNGLDTVSGQSQFGRERNDFGNWFGNNNSNPIWQYVLEDRYVRRNPHAGISQVTAQVSVIPGPAPVYPTSRTLARFNEFGSANRFTSACSTMIYRDTFLGNEYYGNAFTSEPVHNLVSRLVMTRDGYGFKGERAADEQQSEFLASSDNWFRPTMIRTGPDGALWIADMYRAVIEHPEWIPPEYQRKMNLYAGNDRGRIWRIVPVGECCGVGSSPLPISGGEGQGEGVVANDQTASSASTPPIRPSATFSPDLGGEGRTSASGRASALRENGDAQLLGGLTPNRSLAHQAERELRRPESAMATSLVAGRGEAAKSRPAGGTYFEQPWNEIPIADLVQRLESPNGWWRDAAQRILLHRRGELLNDAAALEQLRTLANSKDNSAVTVQAIAMLAAVARDAENQKPGFLEKPGFFDALGSKSPNVRCAAVEHLESHLRAGELDVIGKLKPLASDPDFGVRLQLMLSLGEAKSDTGAALLGQMMRDNFDDSMLRSAGLTSLTPENVSGVLKEALNVPAEELNESLIGILLAQAAAMGKSDQLGDPLQVLVASIAADSPASRFDVGGNTLNGILNSDAAKVLKNDEAFLAVVRKASDAAAAVARDQRADEDRRSAAIRFADVASRFAAGDAVNMSEFFTAQTPQSVQLAAVSVAARRADKNGVDELLTHWSGFSPIVRAELLSGLLQREATISVLLDAVEAGTLSVTDFDAVQRDGLLNHRNESVRTAATKLFGESTPTARNAVVEDFKSQISNLKPDAVAGKVVFEKRCGTCHRLQDVGKEVGADLAALKDRSTDAMLTAILDPNRAVESKFLVYTVVTKDGLQHVGMLKGETGGSLTLIGNDGKEITVVRADIEELAASKRSLMPEGLEKDLSAQDLANVIAFVQSTGTPWKRFDGNSPHFVAANADGTITLPASAAEIYGPSLIFEQKYGNIGFWVSTDDYAKWTFEVPRSGHWTVEFDFACDNSTAGSLIKCSTGARLLTARVPGTGTWDNYQTWQAGTIDLHGGRGQLIVTAPEKSPFALMDLRSIRLLPPK